MYTSKSVYDTQFQLFLLMIGFTQTMQRVDLYLFSLSFRLFYTSMST